MYTEACLQLLNGTWGGIVLLTAVSKVKSEFWSSTFEPTWTSKCSEKNGHLNIYNSMTTVQTPSEDEDHVTWLKAPEYPLNWLWGKIVIQYIWLWNGALHYFWYSKYTLILILECRTFPVTSIFYTAVLLLSLKYNIWKLVSPLLRTGCTSVSLALNTRRPPPVGDWCELPPHEASFKSKFHLEVYLTPAK